MVTQPFRIERWSNDGATTLNGAVVATATTITVTSATNFPTSGDFTIRIGDAITFEYAKVKSVAGSVFTLTTGLTNGYVTLVPVILAIEEGAVTDGFQQAVAATEYPKNRWLNKSVDILPAGFTWLNQGTATAVTSDDDSVNMTLPSEANNQIRGKFITAPGTPWVMTAFCTFGPGVARFSGSSGTMMGIFARESSTGELYQLFIRQDVIAFWRMTNVTTFSADVNSKFLFNQAFETWLQIEDDGVNIIGRVSADGFTWLDYWSESRTAFMAGGPDQVGFSASSGNGAAGQLLHFKSWILE